ncbi:MAG: hypothetical protein IPH59_13905 [bacterium]|nr:hypothetical protein [bacterium]
MSRPQARINLHIRLRSRRYHVRDHRQIVPANAGWSTVDAFLYYFNEAKGEWEFQETGQGLKGVATFKIKHFSKYGIS